MNSHEKFFLIAFLLFLATALVAQSGPADAEIVTEIEVNEAETPATTSGGYRFTKRLPATFSGYAIEITTSDFPLEKDHQLFKSFGKIYYHKTKEGWYSYLLLTKYKRERAVQDYLKKIVLYRVPTAKVVRYKFGKRDLPGAERPKYYPID